jgi:hypothetical protein
MTREEIMTAIQGLAKKLERVPTLTELKTMTPVGRRGVRSHSTTYTNALIACGMLANKKQRIGMDSLFGDWATVARQMQKLPTSTEYEEKGAHSAKAVIARCGSWKRVPHMMLGMAGAGPGKRVAGCDGHGEGGKGTKLAGHGKSVAGPRGRAVGRFYKPSGVWDADEYGSAGACADK